MTLDNLRNLPNGQYNYNNFTCYKKDDIVEIYFPHTIKTSSKNNNIIIDLPNNFKTCFYSQEKLKKLAASCENIKKNKIQSIINKSAKTTGEIPDIIAIKQIYSYITGKQPNKMTFRYSQWGGHGYTLDNGRTNSRINNFFPIGISIDSYLGLARPDNNNWDTSIEKRLEEFHKDIEDDRSKYDLTWNERIRKKNLSRLRNILQERRMREQNEKARSPRIIREQDRLDTNIVGYIPLDERLDNKREIHDEEFIVGRIEETVPDWYFNLPTRRIFSSKLEKKADGGRGAPDPFGYTPGRRNRKNKIYDGREETSRYRAGSPWFNTPFASEENSLGALSQTPISRKIDTLSPSDVENEYRTPYFTNVIINHSKDKEKLPYPKIQRIDSDNEFEGLDENEIIDKLFEKLISDSNLTTENKNKALNENNIIKNPNLETLEEQLNYNRIKPKHIEMWPGGGSNEEKSHPRVTRPDTHFRGVGR